MKKINSPKKRMLSLSLLIVLYAITIIAFIFFILSIPTIYNKMELQKIETTQGEINQLFQNSTDLIHLEENADLLVQQQQIELAITQNDQVIYSTMPTLDLANFRFFVHEKMTLIRSQETVTTGLGTFQVYYLIYHTTFFEYLNAQFILLNISIFILFILFITIFILMNRMLFNPLRQVKKAISKMKNYEFYPINASDAISKNVNEFSEQLQQTFSETSEKFSELELLLLYEKEHLTFIYYLSRALLHEMKTPLHQHLLEKELYLEQEKNLSGQQKHQLQEDIRFAEINIQQINTSLQKLKESYQATEFAVEVFDFIELYNTTVRQFHIFAQQNDISVDVEMPEELYIHGSKFIIEAIIHNILSNAFKYASHSSEVNITIQNDDKNQLHFICINKTSLKNIERFKNPEQMSFLDSNKNYSSRSGVNIAKKLASAIDATYVASTTSEAITIELIVLLQKEASI